MGANGEPLESVAPARALDRRLGGCRYRTFTNLLSSGTTCSAYRIARALQGPVMPFRCKLRNSEQRRAAPALLMVDPSDVADSEPVRGPLTDPNVVAGANLALLHDAQVGAGPARCCEVDGEGGIVHPRTELPAWDAGLGHFEDDAADLPPLAHDCTRDLHARHGEVLPEDAVLELAPELLLPPRRVLASVGIDRLLRPAVELGCGLLITPDVRPAHSRPPLDR